MADIQSPSGIGPVSDPDEYASALSSAAPETPSSPASAPSPGKLAAADITDPNRLAAKLRSSQSYVDDAKSILNDPAYQGTPLQTKQELRDAISKAYDQYQNQKNTNQWLEVAQNLGQALTQFGAAQHAIGTNARFYKAPEETGINYGERTNQAFKEYNQNVGNAKDIAQAGVQDWREANDLRKEKLLREEQIQNRALSQADKEAYFNRLQQNDAARQAHEDARQDKFQQAQAAKDAAQLRGMDLKDTLSAEKALQQQKQAGGQLTNSLSQMLGTGDTSLTNPKDVEKLKLKLAPLAGKAGVDIDDVLEQYKTQAPRVTPDSATGLGWIAAKARNAVGAEQPIDTTQTAKTLDDIIGKDIRDRLAALQAHKQNLLQGNSNQAPSSSTNIQQTPTSTPAPAQSQQPVKMRDPKTGATATVKPDAVKKYLSQGMEIVQ